MPLVRDVPHEEGVIERDAALREERPIIVKGRADVANRERAGFPFVNPKF